MAAVARCRPKARLTGPALLGLLGADGFDIIDPIVVLVPPGRRVQNVPFRVWTDLAPDRDHASVGPVRGVTGTRALIDTAAFPGITHDQLRHAADSLFWAGQSSVGRLGRRARELDGRRHRGAAVILKVLATGVFVQESDGERALARILLGVDPQPQWGVWLAPAIRVDACGSTSSWCSSTTDVSTTRGRPDRAHDQARRRRLEALGYTVVVVTAEDLRDPATLRARLLGLREGLLARQ